MKKYTQLTLLALSIGATTVSADNGGIYLSQKLGIYMPPSSSDYSSATAGTLGIGIKSDSPWGLELTHTMARPNDHLNMNKAIVRYTQINTLYHFLDGERLRPFVSLGLGRNSNTTVIGKTKTDGYNLGAGLKWEWMPRLDVRADLGIFAQDDNQDLDKMLSLGVDYRFFDLTASAEPVVLPAPAPAPVDSDKDGVYDRSDRCPNSSAGVEVDEYGCEIVKVVAPEPVEVSIELAVNFASNSSLVASEYLSEIQAVAMFMEKYPDTDVVVEGHTDDTGKAEYNEWLSSRRAASVAKILVEKFGIAAERVSSKGFGESAPLVANDSVENRAKNRRVVAVIKTVE